MRASTARFVYPEHSIRIALHPHSQRTSTRSRRILTCCCTGELHGRANSLPSSLSDAVNYGCLTVDTCFAALLGGTCYTPLKLQLVQGDVIKRV